MADYIYLIIGIAVLLVGGVAGLVTTRVRGRGRRRPRRRRRADAAEPRVGDDAETPRDTPTRTVEDADLPDRRSRPPAGARSRRPSRPRAGWSGCASGWPARRARSAAACSPCSPATSSTRTPGRRSRTLLITADVGVAPDPGAGRAAAHPGQGRGRLVGVRCTTSCARSWSPWSTRAWTARSAVDRRDGKPAVVLMVGVNGTGKTTTVGKLARVLVAEDKQVVLGAADTFRAAAAEQLATWGERVGVPAVRGPEGSDPASVAFEAVRTGIEQEADVVLVDTAGRLQNKAGLMDELGKVKRVVEKQAPVTEVLLVLDATTGQNGLQQARVFAEVVDVTGIVLTKLDGSAKGGIVVAVQRELGVPVKLVGLGEGADDLAPFDPEAFVDALLGETALTG